jgi:hypothetical protein
MLKDSRHLESVTRLNPRMLLQDISRDPRRDNSHREGRRELENEIVEQTQPDIQGSSPPIHVKDLLQRLSVDARLNLPKFDQIKCPPRRRPITMRPTEGVDE